MGFFAGELAAILQAHLPDGEHDPWCILVRQGIPDSQIKRLKLAADEPEVIAGLAGEQQQVVRRELELTPGEWARLQAGAEADTLLRLWLSHRETHDTAFEKANGVFSQALKDRLATGGMSESIFPKLSERDQAAIKPGPQHHRPRGPRRKDNLDA